jgi:UDP-N-acetylmuramoyl-tripeptide--D-alanyl-D-alanine ligase
MIREFLSMYRPQYPKVLVYMLQNVEYQTGPYLSWLQRTKDFSTVMKRRTLDETKAARMLLMYVQLGILAQISVSLSLVYLGLSGTLIGGAAYGLALFLTYPFVWAYALVLPLIAGNSFIVKPQQRKLVEASRSVFAKHPGVKIAVAGSYGKTSMKELLFTVLPEGLNVAATPANKNVSPSHAYFARKLTGHEDVLIIEYGEGSPGDVARMAEVTQPTHAVITGLAPAHLDQYKTLEAAGSDIFSVAAFVPAGQAYVNADSPSTAPFVDVSYTNFSNKGALGWKVSAVKVELEGTKFTLTKGKESLKLHSGLVGAHQVGFLAFVAAFALELGLTKAQVTAGIAKTKPFEHRMQPYELNGAWVVDDTYNGNLEGIKAGTQLLKDLKAKRKLYVTPGLVDQGDQKETVHIEVGQLIAAAKPDVVVLMKNSVTAFIEDGLRRGDYSGELIIEDNPLEFYANLKHIVAHGDLVVMQNDWTDNYS